MLYCGRQITHARRSDAQQRYDAALRTAAPRAVDRSKRFADSPLIRYAAAARPLPLLFVMSVRRHANAQVIATPIVFLFHMIRKRRTELWCREKRRDLPRKRITPRKMLFVCQTSPSRFDNRFARFIHYYYYYFSFCLLAAAAHEARRCPITPRSGARFAIAASSACVSERHCRCRDV